MFAHFDALIVTALQHKRSNLLAFISTLADYYVRLIPTRSPALQRVCVLRKRQEYDGLFFIHFKGITKRR